MIVQQESKRMTNLTNGEEEPLLRIFRKSENQEKQRRLDMDKFSISPRRKMGIFKP